MFFKLVSRNSRRNRKENGLFFASLLVTIVAFYIILALPRQDVMLFLAKMESNAVDRLLGMIPLFFGVTLFILFFLVYFAQKYQMERRRHEFGVYLMLGMPRRKLFGMLLLEDFGGSLLALAIGVPVAVLLSELISLVTARFVGLGIIGHSFSFSPGAVLWMAVGFLLIKLAAFLILSGRVVRQEIGSLLVGMPEGMKKQLPGPVYGLALALGTVCLGSAYRMGIIGISWYRVKGMGLTLLLGVLGTMLFFFGLRAGLGVLARRGGKDRQLHVFNFRQLQESVIQRSNTLAVSSLLMLAALCFCGAGVGIAGFYQENGRHVLDYTFGEGGREDMDQIMESLKENNLDGYFSELFEIRLGRIRSTENDSPFQMETVLSALAEKKETDDRNSLIGTLEYATEPRLIALSGYNHLLTVAGYPPLELAEGEAAVYLDSETVYSPLMDQVLEERPEVMLAGRKLILTGKAQTVNFVTDRAVRLSFALILPDDMFAEFAREDSDTIYLNGVLNMERFPGESLMNAIAQMNEKLDKIELNYESFLQNMGRQIFYMVAASYLTLYLAIVFLIIANTVIGVQFLMGQRKSDRRYKTLIHLGATQEVLCRSVGKQISWYFGIPTFVAIVSSIFGVRALFTGLLPARVSGSVGGMMGVSAAMILILVVIEWIYIAAVRRSSRRYLLTLMVPEREE